MLVLYAISIVVAWMFGKKSAGVTVVRRAGLRPARPFFAFSRALLPSKAYAHPRHPAAASSSSSVPPSAASSAAGSWPRRTGQPSATGCTRPLSRPIENEYVEPVDSSQLVYGSIDGMLRTLDPHSTLLRSARLRADARAAAGLATTAWASDRGDQRRHHGTARSSRARRRFAPASAAATSSRRSQDDSAKGWTTEQAVAELKGPKGTTVNIGIRRPGVRGADRSHGARATRCTSSTVRAAFMIAPGTGYVRLQDFSDTTEHGARGSAEPAVRRRACTGSCSTCARIPGGPLAPGDRRRQPLPEPGPDGRLHARPDPALRRGVPGPERRRLHRRAAHRAGQPRQRERRRRSSPARCRTTTAPLSSARRRSARRWCSRSTDIANGAGAGADHGALLHAERPRHPAAVGRAASTSTMTTRRATRTHARAHPASELKYTDAGRKVYGGGGIEPDHFVPGAIEGFNPTRFSRSLRGAFVNFSRRFTAEGDTRPASQRTGATHVVSPSWVVTDDILAEFRQMLVDLGVKIDEAAFQADRAFIKARDQVRGGHRAVRRRGRPPEYLQGRSAAAGRARLLRRSQAAARDQDDALTGAAARHHAPPRGRGARSPKI